MPIACFNTENFFSRAKVLNFRNNEEGNIQLAKIAESKNYTNKTDQSFDTVTTPANAASDHGAMWADFNI